MRFLDGEFRRTEGTIGASFATKIITNKQGVKVRIELWDTAGQERFHALAPLYYRSADGAVVAFDAADAATYQRATEWIQELKNHDPNVIIALVANKADAKKSNRLVDAGRQYASENEVLFYETSALVGMNVAELFAELFERISEQTAAHPRPSQGQQPLAMNSIYAHELPTIGGKKKTKACSACNGGSTRAAPYM